MKKINLDLAALKVISFEPAPQSDACGTVKGHDLGLESGSFTCLDATCQSGVYTCFPDATCGTCGYSCEPGSCDYTCDVALTGRPCVYC